MKNKKINALLGLVLCANMLSAQNANPVEIKSPNAATLGLFGDIPVSFYTGTPDISIPIYTIKNGNIEMPITLRYHPAAVKPNEHPGWVGLGWDLQCGGCISRVINGYLDEMDYELSNYPDFYKNKSYYKEGAKKLYGSTDWNQENFAYDNLNTFDRHLSNLDYQADIFYFNFGNHSGRFVWNGNGWTVDSDENITVENITNEESVFFKRGALHKNDSHNNSRQFKQFILRMEDGTKYYFGGSETSVELTINLNSVGDGIEGNSLDICSWYLTKIEDMHGNKVSFSYDNTSAAIGKFVFVWYNSRISHAKKNAKPIDRYEISDSYSSEKVSDFSHLGNVIYPTYLKQVSYNETTILFTRRTSVEKGYPQNYVEYSFSGQQLGGYWEEYYPQWNHIKNIAWQQLDNIQIHWRDKTSTFTFSYSSNENQRLTLNSLQLPTLEKYTFRYKNIIGLPEYGGNYCDHWGYYNGKNIIGVKCGKIEAARDADSSKASVGLLTEIAYPTGGYTKFEWEANVANRVYKKAGNTVESFSTPKKTVGGARIKTITDCNNNGVVLNKRTYTYTDGILSGKPQYHYNKSGEPGTSGYVLSLIDIYEINNLVSYNPNAHGSHIGYSEVVETNYDGSSTTYKYTNYNSYRDQSGGQYGWSLIKDEVYAPYVSLERKRGKLTNQTKKDSDGNVMEKVSCQYRMGTDNTIRRYYNYSKCGAILYMSALSDHTYRYSLSSKTTTKYVNGKSLSTTETYAYNKRDKVKTYTFDSNGEKYTTETRYVYDYYDEMLSTYGISKLINLSFGTISTDVYTQSFWKLWNNGLHDFPIDVIHKKGTAVVGGNLYVYKTHPLNSKAFDLAQVYDLRTASPITTAVKNTIKIEPFQFTPYSKFIRTTIFDLYDGNGNLLQYHNESGKDISMKYDKYNNCIAKIENAKAVETFFDSFDYSLCQAHCGNSSAYGKVSSAKLSLSSLVSPSYTASYWFQGSSSKLEIVAFDKDMNELGVVTSVTGSGSSSTWTYVECVFNKSTITQSKPNCAYICVRNSTGGIYVDDMRFYPTDASMTTYTYGMFGVSSITDENDISTYYYYDTMGRLVRIEDADHNYVKCYEYNYINK